LESLPKPQWNKGIAKNKNGAAWIDRAAPTSEEEKVDDSRFSV
jgi:hypothetical protein